MADDDVADFELAPVDVDVERGRAAHRGFAHAAGDDGGVADEPAPGGEDAFGGDHAVEVVG